MKVGFHTFVCGETSGLKNASQFKTPSFEYSKTIYNIEKVQYEKASSITLKHVILNLCH